LLHAVARDAELAEPFGRRASTKSQVRALVVVLVLPLAELLGELSRAAKDRAAVELILVGSVTALDLPVAFGLYGFNTILRPLGSVSGTSGFTTYPLIEDDPVARRLREIGLDRLDAHHVMLAIKRECAVFVTCDEATILKYRAQVDAEFPIRLTLPSKLVREIQQVGFITT
jgi:hypothetical protein